MKTEKKNFSILKRSCYLRYFFFEARFWAFRRSLMLLVEMDGGVERESLILLMSEERLDSYEKG